MIFFHINTYVFYSSKQELHKEDGSKYDMSLKGDTYTLTILNPTVEDSARYTLVVRMEKDTFFCSGYLEVKGGWVGGGGREREGEGERSCEPQRISLRKSRVCRQKKPHLFLCSRWQRERERERTKVACTAKKTPLLSLLKVAEKRERLCEQQRIFLRKKIACAAKKPPLISLLKVGKTEREREREYPEKKERNRMCLKKKKKTLHSFLCSRLRRGPRVLLRQEVQGPHERLHQPQREARLPPQPAGGQDQVVQGREGNIGEDTGWGTHTHKKKEFFCVCKDLQRPH